MPLLANDDDELRLLRTMRSYLAQHQTDIDRLWKRQERWVVQPIMVTGVEVPVSSSSSETSSEISSSEVSSSEVSSSEASSSEVSSSEVSSSEVSSETSSSIEPSSSASSSDASSSEGSSSDSYSGSCIPCGGCECIHETLYLTIDDYDSFCCGPRTPTDPIPLYWDNANACWDSGCLTPSGNACHSSSNPAALLLIRGARFHIYCSDMKLHYQPYLNFGTPPSCSDTGGLGEQVASYDGLSCVPFLVSYQISVTCGSRTPSTQLIDITVTE